VVHCSVRGAGQLTCPAPAQVAALKAALALEREERIAEDDEIVQAVNDYTKALQEGLKLVSA
jgi:hypothetical protein